MRFFYWLPRGRALLGTLSVLCLLAVPARAQVSRSQPNAGFCEQIVISSLDGTGGFEYPAWGAARFNPADDNQVAALRSEIDSTGVVRRHLYLLNLKTHTQKRLVRDVGCQLAWGRTGWLVLERGSQLWRVKANGDSLARLAPAASGALYPAWSPDGRLLACWQPDSLDTGTWALTLLSPAGRRVRVLPTPGIGLFGPPTWSPDGRKLAFLGRPEKEHQYYMPSIYELELATGKIRTVRQASERHYPKAASVHWLKNGKQLLWRDSERNLAVLNVATGRPRGKAESGPPRVRILSLDVAAGSQRLVMVVWEAFRAPGPGAGTLFYRSRLATAALPGKKLRYW